MLQHDHVLTVATRIVAPLMSEGQMRRVVRLHPVVSFAGQEMIIAIDQAAALPLSAFGEPEGSADHLRYEITLALDLLFTGI